MSWATWNSNDMQLYYTTTLSSSQSVHVKEKKTTKIKINAC